MKTQIIIEVSGGVVQQVFVNKEAEIDVILYDFDDIEAGGDKPELPTGMKDYNDLNGLAYDTDFFRVITSL